MPSIDEIYAGKYITAVETKSKGLVGKVLKISNVNPEMVGREGKQRNRLVLTLDGADKPLVVNKSNSEIIAKAYGRDYSAWVGKTIQLFVVPVRFGSEMVDGITVVIPT